MSRGPNLGRTRFGFTPGLYVAGADLRNLFRNIRPASTTNNKVAPPLPHGYKSTIPLNYSLPYDPHYGLASQACVNLYLTFALFVSTLFNNTANSPVQPDDDVPLFNCDFEDGWCPGWNQSSTTEYRWEVGQGPTATNGTGPSVDHTLFSSEGRYTYVEATGIQFGSKAKFRTPFVDMTQDQNYCLRFWYHMYGNSMGSLKVIWSPPKQAGNAPATIFLITTKSGAQSANTTDWILEEVDVISSTKIRHFAPAYFEFEATRGFQSKSDIAIDDISLSPGLCKKVNQAQTESTTAATHTPQLTFTTKKVPIYLCNGSDYNILKHICCQGTIRRRMYKTSQCCGKRVINARWQGCCNGISVYWIGFRGCCGGRVYTLSQYGCCNDSLFDKQTHRCSSKSIVPIM